MTPGFYWSELCCLTPYPQLHGHYWLMGSGDSAGQGCKPGHVHVVSMFREKGFVAISMSSARMARIRKQCVGLPDTILPMRRTLTCLWAWASVHTPLTHLLWLEAMADPCKIKQASLRGVIDCPFICAVVLINTHWISQKIPGFLQIGGVCFSKATITSSFISTWCPQCIKVYTVLHIKDLPAFIFGVLL